TRHSPRCPAWRVHQPRFRPHDPPFDGPGDSTVHERPSPGGSLYRLVHQRLSTSHSPLATRHGRGRPMSSLDCSPLPVWHLRRAPPPTRSSTTVPPPTPWSAQPIPRPPLFFTPKMICAAQCAHPQAPAHQSYTPLRPAPHPPGATHR